MDVTWCTFPFPDYFIPVVAPNNSTSSSHFSHGAHTQCSQCSSSSSIVMAETTPICSALWRELFRVALQTRGTWFIWEIMCTLRQKSLGNQWIPVKSQWNHVKSCGRESCVHFSTRWITPKGDLFGKSYARSLERQGWLMQHFPCKKLSAMVASDVCINRFKLSHIIFSHASSCLNAYVTGDHCTQFLAEEVLHEPTLSL